MDNEEMKNLENAEDEIAAGDDMSSNENNIEFLRGQERATAYFTQRRFINRIKKFKEEHPDDVEIYENSDGSVLVHFPVKWIHITPSRKIQITEERRERLREQLKRVRESTKNEQD